MKAIPAKMWYWFSRKFHLISSHNLVTVWSNLTPNSMTIPCHLSRLFVFNAQRWHGFWKRPSPGISTVFAKKMIGFSSDLVSFSTKLPSKRREGIRVTFFTGILLLCTIFSCPLFKFFRLDGGGGRRKVGSADVQPKLVALIDFSGGGRMAGPNNGIRWKGTARILKLFYFI